MAKLLIIDDHPLISEGLRLIAADVEADMQLLLVGSAGEGLELAARHKDLDLVLLDLTLPDMHGSRALKEFSRRFPFLPVVILSASQSSEDMDFARQAGAMGYITKATKRETMIQAIKQVLAGETYFPSDAPTDRAMDSSAVRLALTPRQIEVLRLVIEGKSNKEIARLLNIAEPTTKAHITAVFKALNVDNRTKAAHLAYRLGLLSPQR